MSKDKFLDNFMQLLNESVPHIQDKYMLFEAVGLEMDGFMERTYAYELYHQLRHFQDRLGYTGFTIHAEPQKARTEFLNRILHRLSGEGTEDEDFIDFQKRVMPDILVHIPNGINGNIAVVEIKPEKGSVSERFKKDIRVLKEFVDGAEDAEGYLRGIALLYRTRVGINDPDEIKKEYSETIRETIGNSWHDYADKILLLWHPAPGAGPIYIGWSQ